MIGRGSWARALARAVAIGTLAFGGNSAWASACRITDYTDKPLSALNGVPLAMMAVPFAGPSGMSPAGLLENSWSSCWFDICNN